MLKSLKMMAAALTAAVVMAGSASALTSVSAGGSYDITSDNAFIGSVSSFGGPGSYSVNFTSPIDPLVGTANASVTIKVLGAFTGLTMSWVDANTNTVLDATSVLGGVQTTLKTLFSSVSPNSLSQNLVFSWADSQATTNGGPITFDFDVSAGPLPAGGVLLLTALGGLALTRRRKMTAA